MKTVQFTLLAIALIVSPALAFYLPGVAPQEFLDGDKVEVKVNSLTSSKTMLPYTYYDIPTCPPSEELNMKHENLGEILHGDRIFNSPYKFRMFKPTNCQVVCKVPQENLDEESLQKLSQMISEEYRVNMIVDNLPAATKKVYTFESEEGEASFTTVYERGFPLGFVGSNENKGAQEGMAYLNNHITFTVKYHKDVSRFKGGRIVGFEVKAASIRHKYQSWEEKATRLDTCSEEMPFNMMDYENKGLGPLPVQAGQEFIYTYDVVWEHSDLMWASRWDLYLESADNQIHWFSIVNSLMIVMFLTGMVAMIMIRVLRQDFQRYNDLESTEEMQEETGWKLVHGDVFRPPDNTFLLSVFVGTGAQVMGMTVVTMAFALLGFLSPSNRGGLLTALVLVYVFMGILAGYTAARFYKIFKGLAWKRVTLLTGVLFPGLCFVIFFVLNLLVWGQKSAGAVPFVNLFGIVMLWFGVSIPLVFLGAWFGFKKPAIEFPARTNQIPRQIPDQPWYMKPYFAVLVGGVLPFGAVFIELFFILSSIWLDQYYYVFGFLFIVFLILIVTCAEITIVMCYFQLCSEDYHWWWRSFLTSGSSALYLFLYSVLYFSTKLDMARAVSGCLYFGYMLLISLGFFALTGFIGFSACFWFVNKIYGSIKVD
eukprot:GFYU01002103.1.p1 GENE.GFYU01002103.1~~GFYU01002103.1.p1  ORF type:complete len:652 (+),score=198.47 GFYU01002103.1:195-2150(+)